MSNLSHRLTGLFTVALAALGVFLISMASPSDAVLNDSAMEATKVSVNDVLDKNNGLGVRTLYQR